MSDNFHFLRLNRWPILKQLHLEEALLKGTEENWCLVNWGAPPAFVLGISSNLEENVQLPAPFPVIRRYTGGGVVVIDENTFFVSLIGNASLLPGPLYPEHVFEFAAARLKGAFPEPFSLKERDFVFADKKCGGNAQYIGKGRFVHHISFLYRFDKEKLAWLVHPRKEPDYRKKRSHTDFLTALSPYFATLEDAALAIEESLREFHPTKRFCSREAEKYLLWEGKRRTELLT